MPVTPDLKDNEFELAFDCQADECKAKTTFAFNKEGKQYIGQLRKNARKMVKEAHDAGRHTKEYIEGAK